MVFLARGVGGAMRVLWPALVLLGVPLAAATSFVSLPVVESSVAGCGSVACFPLAEGDAVVRVVGGSAYWFVGVSGAALGSGSVCGGGVLDVPAGAVWLVVDPRPCH